MPYKDKAKQREAVKGAVTTHRKGITPEGITQDWQTVSIKGIKAILLDSIVADIIALGEHDRALRRAVTLEERFRKAYKYYVWRKASFIDGIHKGSKHRAMIGRQK